MGPSRQRLQTATMGQHPSACVHSIIETGAAPIRFGDSLVELNDYLRALSPTQLK